MSTVLRPYQSTIIDNTRNLMLRGRRSVLIQSPTGSGKTLLTAHMLGAAAKKQMPSLFLCHRRELIKQSIDTFAEVNVKHGVIAAGFMVDSRHHIQIASVQTLARRLDKIRKPSLIIWDECFLAGTLVDGFPIQDIKVGDYVRTYNQSTGKIEQRKVLRTFKRKAPKDIFMLSALHNFEMKFVWCTGNHKFLTTERGWTECKDLKKGEEIYVMPELSKAAEKRGHQKMLEMLPDSNGEEECFDGPEENARTKSHEESCDKSKGKLNIKSDGPQAKDSRRKRETNPKGTKDACLCAAPSDRGNRKDRDKVLLSNSLQARHSRRESDGDYRSRWELSLRQGKAISRQKKGTFLAKARVDNIKIFERRSNDGPEGVCPDGYVYNIEVEKTHTYFANGILASNCHHVAAKSWSNIHAAFPNAFHIGLTATPERLDGTGLKKWFKEMVTGPTVTWLIENGYLCPYKLYAPPSASLKGVHTRMGDYARNELMTAIDKPTITGDAIKHYKKIAFGKRAVVFCVSIEHSKHVVEQFIAAGIRAVHVDGETPTPERDEAIRRFRNGETTVLSNVELFGEGFDLPVLEVAILLRPTQSLGLHLQQIGRSLRPYPGKSHAIILDHAGNTERHGLPDEERAWSLDGRPDAKSGKEAALGVKVCPKCFAAQPPTPICRFCNFIFPVQPREVDHVDGELVEVDVERMRMTRKREQGTAQSFNDLVELGRKRGYKRPEFWAKHVFNARQAKRLRAGVR